MAKILIKDLKESTELDREAMTKVMGGSTRPLRMRKPTTFLTHRSDAMRRHRAKAYTVGGMGGTS